MTKQTIWRRVLDFLLRRAFRRLDYYHNYSKRPRLTAQQRSLALSKADALAHKLKKHSGF